MRVIPSRSLVLTEVDTALAFLLFNGPLEKAVFKKLRPTPKESSCRTNYPADPSPTHPFYSHRFLHNIGLIKQSTVVYL